MTTSASPGASGASLATPSSSPCASPRARRPARGLGGERLRAERGEGVPGDGFPRVGVFGDESSRAAVLGDERPRERASVRGAREVGHAQAFDAARAPRVAPRAAAQPERGADRLGGHHAPRRAVSLRRFVPAGAPRVPRVPREVPLDLCGGASERVGQRRTRRLRSDQLRVRPQVPRAAGPGAEGAPVLENRVGEARDPSLPRTRTVAGVRRRIPTPQLRLAPRQLHAQQIRASPRGFRAALRVRRGPERGDQRAPGRERRVYGARVQARRRDARRERLGARTAGGVAGGGVRVAAREGASCQRRRCTHHRRACAGHRYVQRGAHGLPVIGRALQDRAPVLHGARRVRRAQNRGLRGAQPVSLGGHGHALYAQGAFQELERLFALPTLTQNARVHQARLAVAHRATRLELRAHRRRQLHERGVARGSVGVAGGGVAVPRLEQSAADGPHDVLRVVAQSVQLHRARLLLDERPAARVRLEQRPQVLRVARLRLGGGFEHGHRLLRPSRVLVEKRQRVQHGIVPRAFQSHGLAQVHSLVVPAHALQNDPLQHASDLHRGELAQQLAIDGLQRRFVVSAVDHLVDGLELAVEGHGVHLLGAPRGLRLAHLADRGGRRRRPR